MSDPRTGFYTFLCSVIQIKVLKIMRLFLNAEMPIFQGLAIGNMQASKSETCICTKFDKILLCRF